MKISKDTLEKMHRTSKECESYVDEVSESDAIEEKKREARDKIEQLNPDQPQKALELLECFGNSDSKEL